jgi:hypothetical protein
MDLVEDCILKGERLTLTLGEHHVNSRHCLRLPHQKVGALIR